MTINTSLKRVFTIFNIFFAVVGGIIIALALLLQILTKVEGHNIEGRLAGLIALYVFGAITMVVAVLGAYGAHKESKAALIAFLVCMVIGSLVTLRIGIPAALSRSEMRGILEKKFQQFLPLDAAGDDVKNMADALQTQMHCCGLFRYTDWREDIPDSCSCDPEVEAGECRTVGYALLLSKSIYAEPCFPILMSYVLLVVDISLGVVFTLAVLAILGMTLSSIMIHQMRFPDRPTILFPVPAVFAVPPPKYQELHNPPGY